MADDRDVLLEQWKVAADHLIQGLGRREDFARFYLALNGAVLTAAAAIGGAIDDPGLLLLPLLCLGAISSVIWAAQDHVLTLSLRQRQAVVEELEQSLPAQPFTHTKVSDPLARASSWLRRALPLLVAAVYLAAGFYLIGAALS